MAREAQEGQHHVLVIALQEHHLGFAVLGVDAAVR